MKKQKNENQAKEPKERKTRKKTVVNESPATKDTKVLPESENKSEEESVLQEQSVEEQHAKVDEINRIIERHERDNKIPEEDINAMLLFTGLTRVPEFNGNQIWTKAIAKVLKRDTSVSFCVLERTGWDTHRILKIFGKCSGIVKVGKPIPIEVMPEDFIKQFYHSDIEGRKSYLKSHNPEKADEYDNMTLEELKTECSKTDLMVYLKENAK